MEAMTGEFNYVLRIAQSPPSEQQIESAIEGTRDALTKVIGELKAKIIQSPDAQYLQSTLNSYETALRSNDVTIRKGMLENSMREFEYQYLVGPDANYIELDREATPDAPTRQTSRLLVSRRTQGTTNLSIQYDSSTRMAIVSHSASKSHLRG